MDKVGKNRITAKTLNQALMSVAIIIWLAMYAYMLSSKSSPFADDYMQKLQEQQADIDRKIALAVKLSACPEELVRLNRLLCQIKLCQKDPSVQKVYLPALIQMTERFGNDYSLSNIDIFAGNIYRDSGQYETAKDCYERSIALSNNSQSSNNNNNNNENSNHPASQITIRRSLNNLGVLYYLLAKGSTDEVRVKNYLLATKYFDQAALIHQVYDNKYLSQTIENNRQECLAELKFLNCAY